MIRAKRKKKGAPISIWFRGVGSEDEYCLTQEIGTRFEGKLGDFVVVLVIILVGEVGGNRMGGKRNWLTVIDSR